MTTELVPYAESRALVCVETARRLLAEAKTLPEVCKIRDYAQAAAHLAKVRDNSLQAAIDASEIKVRAERRLGEMLREMPKHNGDPSYHDGRGGKPPTLSDMGFTYNDSSRWQKIASIPEEEFEEHLEECREEGEPATTKGTLNLAPKKEVVTTVGPDGNETLIEVPYNLVSELKFLTRWLDDRRDTWPEHLRGRFTFYVGRILEGMEASEDDAGGEGETDDC